MDNYEISRNRAQSYFLRYDQTEIIKRWNLRYDENYIYVRFLNRSYRICRKTGSVVRIFDGRQASYSEVLSIFDLLCHNAANQFLTGNYAPVNSLRGCPVSVGVDSDFHGKTAALIDKNPEVFCAVCNALGGRSVRMGDMGFTFRVFEDIYVILKFYHSDEDFPASITFLWDENTLRFIYYETVFYIAGFLLGVIAEEMKLKGEKYD